MGMTQKLARRLTRGLWVKVMERAGRSIGRWVDTSADAPASRFTEKRHRYEEMVAEDELERDKNDHDHDHAH